MGIAVIIPNISFADANLGQVTLTGEVPVQGITINAESSYAGTSAQLSVLYNPLNTTQRGVTWSIESGSEYASINSSTGLLTIKEGASASSVTVKAVSTRNGSVIATKTIRVTYGGESTKFYFEYGTFDMDKGGFIDSTKRIRCCVPIKQSVVLNIHSGLSSASSINCMKLLDGEYVGGDTLFTTVNTDNTYSVNYDGTFDTIWFAILTNPQRDISASELSSSYIQITN